MHEHRLLFRSEMGRIERGSLPPLQGESPGWMVPGVETPG